MTRTGLLLFAFSATLVAGGIAATPAAAQNNSANAESIFQEAQKLLKNNKIKEACLAFESSFRIENRASTMLNLAYCHEKEGRLATAWDEFLKALQLAKEEKIKQHQTVANQHIARLKPLLSKLTLEVGPEVRVDGLVIKRGGVEINPATWNYALPVDGGVYTFQVSAPNRVTWEGSVTVAAKSDTKTIRVPILALIPKPPPKPPTALHPAVVSAQSAPSKPKDPCERAEQTLVTLRNLPADERKRGLRLVEIALKNPCFAKRTLELAALGIKLSCDTAQLDKATFFFRHANSDPSLATQCPAHLNKLVQRDAAKK